MRVLSRKCNRVKLALKLVNFGLTGGVGIEWAFVGGWSARVEYDFIGLQSHERNGACW